MRIYRVIGKIKARLACKDEQGIDEKEGQKPGKRKEPRAKSKGDKRNGAGCLAESTYTGNVESKKRKAAGKEGARVGGNEDGGEQDEGRMTKKARKDGEGQGIDENAGGKERKGLTKNGGNGANRKKQKLRLQFLNKQISNCGQRKELTVQPGNAKPHPHGVSWLKLVGLSVDCGLFCSSKAVSLLPVCSQEFMSS